MLEMFEGTKEVIRSCTLRKDKRTNNVLQNTRKKAKDNAKRIPLKTGGWDK
jgi:hypothetical protein